MRKHKTTEEKLLMIRERLPVLEEKDPAWAETVNSLINLAFSGAMPLEKGLAVITDLLRALNLPIHRVGFVMPLPSKVQARITEVSEMMAKAFHALYVTYFWPSTCRFTVLDSLCLCLPRFKPELPKFRR